MLSSLNYLTPEILLQITCQILVTFCEWREDGVEINIFHWNRCIINTLANQFCREIHAGRHLSVHSFYEFCPFFSDNIFGLNIQFSNGIQTTESPEGYGSTYCIL